MPAERISMRQVREILRLLSAGDVAVREIARRTGVAPSTVRETVIGPEFMDALRFPTLAYAGSCQPPGIGGMLGLHGITRPVTLEVTVLKVGANPRTQLPTVGFQATTTLKRSDCPSADWKKLGLEPRDRDEPAGPAGQRAKPPLGRAQQLSRPRECPPL